MRPIPFLSVPCTAIFLAGAASSQSLYGISSNGDIVGFNGPKAGACNYPSGPLLAQYGYVNPFPCPPPTLLPAAPSLLGDIAMDRINDELWITDGTRIDKLANYGTILAGFDASGILTGALTGLGVNASTGEIWITDGTEAAALIPPPDPGCPGSPGLSVAPFTLPLSGGALATDIEWDAATGSLWTCDDQGRVTNVQANGALGAFGSVTPGGSCALGSVLHGLAVDTGAAAGTLYVTDGAKVYYMTANGGGPAASTFYSPLPCNPTPAPLKGLCFASTTTLYGSASSGFFPILGATSQSVIPNLNFSIDVAGTTLNAVVVLAFSSLSVCPSFPILGVPALILPIASPILGVKIAPSTGLVNFPLPIGNAVPPGATLYLQAFTLNTATSVVKSSPGLELTTALP